MRDCRPDETDQRPTDAPSHSGQPADSDAAPGAIPDAGTTSEERDASSGGQHSSRRQTESVSTEMAGDRTFGWRGWVLVGAIAVSFVIIPGILYLYPHVGPRTGLSFWATYLILPLIPAVFLGLLAVWATTRP